MNDHSCPTCGADSSRPPIIYRSTSAREGSCCFCSRWVDHRGVIDHPVTIVKVQATFDPPLQDHNGCLVVRFCDPCLDALKKARR